MTICESIPLESMHNQSFPVQWCTAGWVLVVRRKALGSDLDFNLFLQEIQGREFHFPQRSGRRVTGEELKQLKLAKELHC